MAHSFIVFCSAGRSFFLDKCLPEAWWHLQGGHVQDAAQTRRDWQRAEVLISRLRAEIARLEAELFKRDVGGHVQDAAQTRRDWQRAEVLISRLRAEIARLEAELFKRDVQLEAGQWMYQQSLAHQASLQVMRDEIRSCEAKQTESDKRLELLQATTASRSQEQEKALLVALQQHKKLQDETEQKRVQGMATLETTTASRSQEQEKALLVALQQHKKLQDETEQKRVQGMATLETRLSEWTRYAMERDKELGKTQEQLRLATEANERAKKHKDGPS
eukprot:s4551_g8.t1